MRLLVWCWERRWFKARRGQQEDEEFSEAGEEGYAPDEGNQEVGVAHSAQLGVVQWPTHRA